MDNENEFQRLKETTVSSADIFDGHILHVKRDTVALSDGSETFREIIRHIGAVCVIPVTDDGMAVMEHQYRYPPDRVILEIPAGKLDSADEDRLSAAKRELQEETGYTADEWIPLGGLYSAPAYSDEYITMYLARGLRAGARHLDEGEFLDVVLVPLSDLVEQVMDGSIVDAKTQVCILKAARILGIA